MINPYQAPSADFDLENGQRPERPQPPDFPSSFRRPAAILGLLAIGWSLYVLAVSTVLILDRSGLNPWSAHTIFAGVVQWEWHEFAFFQLVTLLIVVVNVLISIGVWNMLNGKCYRRAKWTCIAALIPYLTPVVVFGIPFGILCLIKLHDVKVRQAFSSETQEQG